MRACFDAVTTQPRAHSGPATATASRSGSRADFVLLQAPFPIEAIRLRAQRLAVVRGGRIIARCPAATATLALPGRPEQVDFTSKH